MFASETLLQIEEGQFLPVLERHDLAVENDFGVQLAGVIGQFGKLIRHPAQVPRKNFHAVPATVKLGADAVELVFHVNGRCAGEAFPDRLRGWLGTGEHALDRAKQRKFGAL